MIRVCLIEDQTLVRQGIQSLLEMTEDIRVVGNTLSGGCTTLTTRTLTGTHQTWGDRWIVP